MEQVTELAAVGGKTLMVFAPVLPFFAQLYSMISEKSSEGFSPFICLVLLIANILRICFWFGEYFGLELVFQSIVMILMQLFMLQVWHRLYFGKSNPNSRRQSFWFWRSFIPYLVFLGGFTITVAVFTLLLNRFDIYVQTIGFLALGIESLLGVPQVWSNFSRHDASGISLGLIGGWFLGDGIKTIFYIATGAPFQFLMCGIIQLSVDTLIVAQMIFYGTKSRVQK